MSNEPSGGRSARSWEGWAGEHEDHDKVTPEVAGDELFEMLFRLEATNVLSAKQACVLAF